MFVMLNDGGTPKESNYDMAARILMQREFIFGLLTSGVAVTLLHGAEFRDSKVGWSRIMTVKFTWTNHRYFLSCLRNVLGWKLASRFQLLSGTQREMAEPNWKTL